MIEDWRSPVYTLFVNSTILLLIGYFRNVLDITLSDIIHRLEYNRSLQGAYTLEY